MAIGKCGITTAVPNRGITFIKSQAFKGDVERFQLAPEPVTGYPLYTDKGPGDRRTGFYVLQPQEATNLLYNPTFFRDLVQWSGFNSKILRTNVFAFDSGFSLLIRGSGDVVTTERREYAESEIFDFINGQIYVFSMYAWIPQLWDPITGDPTNSDEKNITISIVEADEFGVETEVFSDRLSQIETWVRLEVSKLISNTAVRVFVRANLRGEANNSFTPPHAPTGDFNLQSEFAFFDMGQFELGTEPTTPFHGDTHTCATNTDECEGYRWLGAPHDSPSFRSGCTRDGGVLKSFSELGFEILSHTGHSAPPVRDISFPYSNRPGEFYEKTAVDARVLTFTGFCCETSLKQLEICIANTKDLTLPDIGTCKGKFLLIYRHEDCLDSCKAERDLAICVTYIGGWEGARDNLFQQRATLQFKAHDPFWFEWPGHSSQALSYIGLVGGGRLTKINADGTGEGFPLSGGADYREFACLSGANHFVLGGEFECAGAADNIQVYDCDEFCDLAVDVKLAGPVTALESDGGGNVLIGSSEPPFISIIHANGGSFGVFPGYPGGTVLSIATPFWAQVVVGTATAVYANLNDGSWLTYATNGPVNALDTDAQGNLYAGGDFTTIDGVSAVRFAKLDINAAGCLDVTQATWSSIGFGFDDEIRAITVDKETNAIYVGGCFQNTVPESTDICILTEGVVFDSKGANQELHFTDLGGGVVDFEARLLNIITREQAEFCTSFAPATRYIRVKASSTFGTQYNFIFGSHNVTAVVKATVVGPPDLYTIKWTINSTAIGEPCASNDPSFAQELADSVDLMELFAPLTLPGGVGIDNAISSISVQCIQLTTSFTPDPTPVNNIACIIGGSAIALGDGLPSCVEKITIHPETKELWTVMENTSSEYKDALAIWNGQVWCEFAGDLSGQAVDVDYCKDDCSLFILSTGDLFNAIPGTAFANYAGSVETPDFELIVHGPGQVHEFIERSTENKLKMCVQVECDEIATFDFATGVIQSNFRSLSPNMLPGSRLDMTLNKCENPFSLFITDDDSSTHATLLWRNQFWGIEHYCDFARHSFELANLNARNCCNTTGIPFHRDPDDFDCDEQGWSPGDIVVNVVGNCPRIYVKNGEDCGSCDTGFVDPDGNIITINGQPFSIGAPPDPIDQVCCNTRGIGVSFDPTNNTGADQGYYPGDLIVNTAANHVSIKTHIPVADLSLDCS